MEGNGLCTQAGKTRVTKFHEPGQGAHSMNLGIREKQTQETKGRKNTQSKGEGQEGSVSLRSEKPEGLWLSWRVEVD